MKRLLAIACVALGGFAGTSLVAQAADNGVGPSDSGSTGTARACEVHAENKGESKARGLECVSTSTTTTLLPTTTTSTSTTTTTVVSNATLDIVLFDCFPGFAVFIEVTGTGLAPGTDVLGNGAVFGQADASGNFSITEGLGFDSTITFSATTAEDTTITETFVTPASCPA